jgi:hypothetical protein
MQGTGKKENSIRKELRKNKKNIKIRNWMGLKLLAQNLHRKMKNFPKGHVQLPVTLHRHNKKFRKYRREQWTNS